MLYFVYFCLFLLSNAWLDVLFCLHTGATDDVCNICYAMVEEAIQVLFSIYYNKKLTVYRFMENFENLVD
jgi:hypothetical protein